MSTLLAALISLTASSHTFSGWSYIDRLGNVVIEGQFADASPFSDGLAQVKVDNAYGYINRSGDLVIPATFDAAQRFSEGVAAVRDNEGHWGYIYASGEYAITPRFQRAWPFKEGLAAVELKEPRGKLIFINQMGEEVLSGQYWGLNGLTTSGFSEGVSSYGEEFSYTHRYGLINQQGDIILRPKYIAAFSFREGVAMAWRSEGVQYLNHKGEPILNETFPFGYPFSEGLALVQDNAEIWKFINKNGKTLITIGRGDFETFTYQAITVDGPADFEYGFNEGLAPILSPAGNYFINKKGNRHLPKLNFKEVKSFSEGLAPVVLE